MRTKILFASLLIASIQQARATDRAVGANTLFPTISAALAVSADGDRILLEAGQYDEYLSLDKDISILSAQEGTRPTIKGLMRFISGPSARKIHFSGVRLLSYLETTPGIGRLDVSIVDSYVKNQSFNGGSANLHVTLLRDTLPAGIQFHSGTVIGNVIGGVPNSSSSYLSCSAGTSLPDPLIVIGNIVLPTNDGNNPVYEIDLTVSSVFHVQNNYLSTPSAIRPFLHIGGSVPFGAAPSSITNNTFYRSSPSGLTAITATVNNCNVDIQNNAVIGDTGPLISWVAMKGTVSNNLYAAPSWINTSTGQPTPGSPLLNAGDPAPHHLDLDLTTNDVGCYGGSNSRANFITPLGSAVVGFIKAPRAVPQGGAVDISATGFDR